MVTFPVVIEISTFRDGTINVTSSNERFNSDHEKESAVRLLEKLNEQLNEQKVEMTLSKNELHTLQPQSLEPTEEIRHR
jgi:hypothetical protein